MSSKFNCSVKINGQKFDVVISNINSSPTFSQIYPKIREIIKIGANEDVNTDSHDFQIFENPKKIKWIDESLDQIVLNKSLIAVESKPQLSGDQQTVIFEDNCSSVEVNSNNETAVDTEEPQTPQSLIETLDQLTETESETDVQILIEEPDLQRNEEEVKLFHSIVMSINIGWDLWPHSRSSCRLNWIKVATNLDKIRPDSNLYSLEINGLFYHWSKFYSKNYDRLNDKLVPKHQQIFDLLKIVHILDLDQLFHKYNKIYLKLQNISRKRSLKQYFAKHLAELRQQKVDHKCKSTDRTELSNSPQSMVSVPDQLNQNIDTNESQANVHPLKRLVEGKHEIKLFQSIVMAINIGWDLRTNCETGEPNINWQKVAFNLKKSDIILEVSRVSALFFEWTEFYAQNYDKLNDNLMSKHQQIFDLLKVVHILDLKNIYETENNCRKIIESISESEEFIDYFDRHLSHLKRDKILRSVAVKSPNGLTLIEEPILEGQEHELKRFQSIVMAIEHSLSKPYTTPGKSSIRWLKVVERLRETDSQLCLDNNEVKHLFHLWVRFYINNYDRLNDKLVAKHQQIFDLLKIVHILDLNRIYSKKEDWGLKVGKIFQKTELQEYYYKHLKQLKTENLQIVSKHKSNSNSEISSDYNDNNLMISEEIATSSTSASKNLEQNQIKCVKTGHKTQEINRNITEETDENNTNDSKSEEIVRLKRKLESLEEVFKTHLSNCESNCCKKVNTEKDIEIIELN